MSLTDKVAIITGASSGIGQGMAIWFSKCGASLVLHGRNIDGLNATIEQLDPVVKDKVVKVIGDVRHENTLKMLVDEAINRFGRINILVNNAGMVKFGTFEEMELSDYDETFDVNLRSVFSLTKLCLPHLISSKASVINISSVSATDNSPDYIAYSVSKAALNKFTKCLALELASKGVRVNSINVGTVKTQIYRDLLTEEKVEQLLKSEEEETH